MAKFVIDGTGHDSEMCQVVARKNGIKLNTATGDVIGERSLDVAEGERQVVEGTKENIPWLCMFCGMASSAVGGTPRMGPIFGGMLLSGKKVAEAIIKSFEIESKTGGNGCTIATVATYLVHLVYGKTIERLFKI